MTMPEGPGGQPGYPPTGEPTGPTSPYPTGPAPAPGAGYPPPPGPGDYQAPVSPPGPQPYYPGPGQEVPPPKRRNRGGLVALVVLVVLVVAIAGAWWLFFRDRTAGSVTELHVGDCIDEPAQTSSITEVQHQPCSDPHDGEVFLLVTDPAPNGDPYPASDHFLQIAASQCLPAASTYVGAPIEQREELDVGYFYPTASSWSGSNDRGITCYLYNRDGSKITGSLRAAGPVATP